MLRVGRSLIRCERAGYRYKLSCPSDIGKQLSLLGISNILVEGTFHMQCSEYFLLSSELRKPIPPILVPSLVAGMSQF